MDSDNKVKTAVLPLAFGIISSFTALLVLSNPSLPLFELSLGNSLSVFKVNAEAVSTCLGVNREVGLSLQDAVNYLGTVPVGRIICIRGRHLQN